MLLPNLALLCDRHYSYMSNIDEYIINSNYHINDIRIAITKTINTILLYIRHVCDTVYVDVIIKSIYNII